MGLVAFTLGGVAVIWGLLMIVLAQAGIDGWSGTVPSCLGDLVTWVRRLDGLHRKGSKELGRTEHWRRAFFFTLTVFSC